MAIASQRANVIRLTIKVLHKISFSQDQKFKLTQNANLFIVDEPDNYVQGPQGNSGKFHLGSPTFPGPTHKHSPKVGTTAGQDDLVSADLTIFSFQNHITEQRVPPQAAQMFKS